MQDARSGGQRARQRDPLALPTRQRDAALADQRVVAVGQGGHVARQPGRLRRALDARAAASTVAAGAAERDVLGDRRREQERLLRRVADHPAQRPQRQRRDVMAADEQRPGRDLGQARDGVDQRGLPRPGRPTMASVCPAGSENETPSRIARPSRRTVIPFASMAGTSSAPCPPRPPGRAPPRTSAGVPASRAPSPADRGRAPSRRPRAATWPGSSPGRWSATTDRPGRR